MASDKPKMCGRILIADDEKTFVEALADLLRGERYECQSVSDAFAAAAELNTGQYDLLIADIRMPGNPDLELIRHLPQIAEGLAVILVTAYPSPDSALRSAQLPVLSYLPKPVQMEKLMPLVRRGVAHSTVFRLNKQIAQRLSEWLTEAQSLRRLMANNSAGHGITPESYVGSTVKNMVRCLADLDAAWDKICAIDGQGDPEVLSEALAAAMAAFETAGASFRG